MKYPTKKQPALDKVEGVDKTLLRNLVQSLNNIVESNQQMVRAFIMLAVIVLLAIILLEYFRRWWKDDFELHFPFGGTAIVLHASGNSNDFKSAVFIVPASKCWVNTGLEIKPDSRITIRASGQIHLAVNQIEQEKMPLVAWSEPEGSSFVKLDSIDRSDFLIHKHYDHDRLQIGNLVGYFLPVDENDNDEAQPSYKNPHPKAYGGVFHIGNRLENKLNNTGKTVNLWLCVNDLILEDSPKAKDAYLGSYTGFINNFLSQAKIKDSITTGELPELKLKAIKLWNDRKKEWPKIKARKAWDLYYYDNIGHYLVMIEKGG